MLMRAPLFCYFHYVELGQRPAAFSTEKVLVFSKESDIGDWSKIHSHLNACIGLKLHVQVYVAWQFIFQLKPSISWP